MPTMHKVIKTTVSQTYADILYELLVTADQVDLYLQNPESIKFTEAAFFLYLRWGYVFTHVCSLLDWLVCQQEYTKTAETISTKPGWRKGVGLE